MRTISGSPSLHKLNWQAGKALDGNKQYPGSHRKELSYLNFTAPAIPTTPKERSGDARCSFIGAHCPIEAVEHELVEKYLLPSDSVLELGGRFGTTSCQIAAKQDNSGRLVVVEPDQLVWNLLAQNRIEHSCNFWIFHGVISNAPVIIESANYATRAVTPGSDEIGKKHAGFMHFDTIQERTGVHFNALLIDCEGCINAIFRNKQGDASMKTITSYLSNVEVIILEADMPMNAPDCIENCVDYNAWLKRFKLLGFTKVHEKPDVLYDYIVHYVFERVEARNKKRGVALSG
jgi:hypothetical protein